MRTDLHRPSVIKPEDYFFVACDYLGGGLEALAFTGERQAFREHMKMTGGKFAAVDNSGSCDICGARAAYVARFHHTPSNTYLTTGMDCAQKMDIGDPLLFKSFRKRVQAGLKTARGKLRAQELLTGAGLAAAWDVYQLPVSDRLKKEEFLIHEIVTTTVRNGALSEPQAKYLAKLLAGIGQRAEREEQQRIENENAAPVPVTEARVQFRGTLLTFRDEEGFYGTVRKALVRHESGYKLWGNLPSCLWGARQGDLLEFSAKVERSQKDEKFGFFHRPTKAKIIEQVPA